MVEIKQIKVVLYRAQKRNTTLVCFT